MLTNNFYITVCMFAYSFLTLFILFRYDSVLSVRGLSESNRKSLGNFKEIYNKFKSIQVRDFFHYPCKTMVRIGGRKKFVSNAPDPLYRIDGAWFVCMDNPRMAPKNNTCQVISFGVRDDFTFDEEMNRNFGCHVYSFDPFQQPVEFKHLELMNSTFGASTVVNLNAKWDFIRVGVVGRSENTSNQLMTFEDIVKKLGIYETVIDIFKMDIEGEEKSVLMNIDMDYICKYVKQIMFETHRNFNFSELSRLEKCFYLFHRHTRLFMHDIYGTPTGDKSEFQNGFKLELRVFGNEVNLAEYMFVNGEFYFVNENFL